MLALQWVSIFIRQKVDNASFVLYSIPWIQSQNQVGNLHVLREITVPELRDVDGSLSSGLRCTLPETWLYSRRCRVRNLKDTHGHPAQSSQNINFQYFVLKSFIIQIYGSAYILLILFFFKYFLSSIVNNMFQSFIFHNIIYIYVCIFIQCLFCISLLLSFSEDIPN